MTQSPGGYAPSHETQNTQSTTEVARDEAADIARTAARSGGDVAGTVGEQAKRVTAETTRQARDLLGEGKGQLAEQAREGQRKAADSVRTLADQLQEMSQKSDGTGIAPELVQQAAERAHTVASWLERHEPGDLLREVRAFARRKPGVFLMGAALAGVAAGRLTRGIAAAQSDNGSDTGSDSAFPASEPAAAVPTQAPPAVATPAPNPAYAGDPLPRPAEYTTPGYTAPPPPTGSPMPPPGPVTR
jgi:hypothetical protein